MWPEFIDTVDGVLFEHSPGRGASRFTADGTAFDVVVLGRTSDGRRSFVAFEVKYTESMTEPPAQHRARYDELGDACGIFKDARSLCLRAIPLQQLWREHLLTQAVIREGFYDVGLFVVVHPARNQQAADAVASYSKQLVSEVPSESGFASVTIEQLLDARRADGDAAFADAFHARYLDIQRVEQLIFEPAL